MDFVKPSYRLSCAEVDPLDCHVACGFDDSTIRLWQINQSTMKGRKPFASHMRQNCEWSLDNDYLDLSSTDSDDSDDDGNGKLGVSHKRCKRNRKDQLLVEDTPVEGEGESLL